MIQFTGLDPFVAPDPTAPALLGLVELVQAMRDRSLKSAAALYLIWNQDLSGKSTPPAAQVTELARTLRGDFAEIDSQFSLSEDPNGDVARARMTLVYGQEVSDAFFGLLDDTRVVDVAYTHSSPHLEEAITKTDPAIAYDDFRHRLSHRGLVTEDQKKNLRDSNNVGDVSPDFEDAVNALFDRSEQIKGLFFTAHPELQAPYDIAVVAAPTDRHSAFLAAFDPQLARRRKRQQALQRLSAMAGVDLTFTQAMLDAAKTSGLHAQFFFRDTATGAVDQTVEAAANLDYASGGNNPLPSPGNAISGTWSGQVETPDAGLYNLVVA